MGRTKYTNPMDSTPGLGASGVGRGNTTRNGSNRTHLGGLKQLPDTTVGDNGSVTRGNYSSNYPSANQRGAESVRQGMYNVPAQQMTQEQPMYQHGSVDCVYAIKTIQETDLTNYGFFRKMSEGVPLFCNMKYNLSLVETGSGVHYGSGQQLNAVIYGKILNAVLNPQDLVRVRGRYKHGVFVVNQIFSENFGQYLNIKRTWSNPDKVAIQDKQKKSPIPFILVGLIVLLAIIYFAVQYLFQMIGGGTSSGVFSNLGSSLSTVLIVGILLVGLYMNRFRIFQSKAFMVIFLLTIAVLVAKFVPGGEGLVTEIGTIVITLGALIWMVKGLFR